jgi:ribosomal protein S18 acetylase RimI-like enzyme
MKLGNALIRLACGTDASGLSKFMEKTFLSTFGHIHPHEENQIYIDTECTEGKCRELIESPAHSVWVAFPPQTDTDSSPINDQLIGFCVVGPASLPTTTVGSGEVKKLYVDIPYFGTGLANTLFEIGIAWLRTNYADFPIFLGVYSENFRAIAFYKRYKFEQVSTYEYKVGKEVDIDFIFKELDSTAGLALPLRVKSLA